MLAPAGIELERGPTALASCCTTRWRYRAEVRLEELPGHPLAAAERRRRCLLQECEEPWLSTRIVLAPDGHLASLAVISRRVTRNRRQLRHSISVEMSAKRATLSGASCTAISPRVLAIDPRACSVDAPCPRGSTPRRDRKSGDRRSRRRSRRTPNSSKHQQRCWCARSRSCAPRFAWPRVNRWRLHRPTFCPPPAHNRRPRLGMWAPTHNPGNHPAAIRPAAPG